jgi:hypothetical protein
MATTLPLEAQVGVLGQQQFAAYLMLWYPWKSLLPSFQEVFSLLTVRLLWSLSIRK